VIQNTVHRPEGSLHITGDTAGHVRSQAHHGPLTWNLHFKVSHVIIDTLKFDTYYSNLHPYFFSCLLFLHSNQSNSFKMTDYITIFLNTRDTFGTMSQKILICSLHLAFQFYSLDFTLYIMMFISEVYIKMYIDLYMETD